MHYPDMFTIRKMGTTILFYDVFCYLGKLLTTSYYQLLNTPITMEKQQHGYTCTNACMYTCKHTYTHLQAHFLKHKFGKGLALVIWVHLGYFVILFDLCHSMT